MKIVWTISCIMGWTFASWADVPKKVVLVCANSRPSVVVHVTPNDDDAFSAQVTNEHGALLFSGSLFFDSTADLYFTKNKPDLRIQGARDTWASLHYPPQYIDERVYCYRDPAIHYPKPLQPICGEDLRVPSQERSVGRMWIDQTGPAPFRNGCSGVLVSPSCMISAGHCGDYLKFAQFNVPREPSLFPSALDQYEVDTLIDFERQDGFRDWAVFRLKKNAFSNKNAGEVQGFYRVRLENLFAYDEAKVRITGYGVSQNEKSGTQQSHSGTLLIDPEQAVLSYDIYTSSGNSGSPVILEATNEVIGVHTNSGCFEPKSRVNSGTAIWNHPRFKNAILQCISETSSSKE